MAKVEKTPEKTPEIKPEEEDIISPNRDDDPSAKSGLFGWTNPKKESTPETPKRRGRPPKSQSVAMLRTQLEQQFAFMGMALMMVNEYDGKTIVANAPNMADTLAQAAAQNPRVKKMLERLMATGTFAQLIMGFAPCVIPIMANHKIVPIHMAALFTDDLPPIEGSAKVVS